METHEIANFVIKHGLVRYNNALFVSPKNIKAIYKYIHRGFKKIEFYFSNGVYGSTSTSDHSTDYLEKEFMVDNHMEHFEKIILANIVGQCDDDIYGEVLYIDKPHDILSLDRNAIVLAGNPNIVIKRRFK